jgi:hypothetical protein
VPGIGDNATIDGSFTVFCSLDLTSSANVLQGVRLANGATLVVPALSTSRALVCSAGVCTLNVTSAAFGVGSGLIASPVVNSALLVSSGARLVVTGEAGRRVNVTQTVTVEGQLVLDAWPVSAGSGLNVSLWRVVARNESAQVNVTARVTLVSGTFVSDMSAAALHWTGCVVQGSAVSVREWSGVVVVSRDASASTTAVELGAGVFVVPNLLNSGALLVRNPSGGGGSFRVSRLTASSSAARLIADGSSASLPLTMNVTSSVGGLFGALETAGGGGGGGRCVWAVNGSVGAGQSVTLSGAGFELSNSVIDVSSGATLTVGSGVQVASSVVLGSSNAFGTLELSGCNVTAGAVLQAGLIRGPLTAADVTELGTPMVLAPLLGLQWQGALRVTGSGVFRVLTGVSQAATAALLAPAASTVSLGEACAPGAGGSLAGSIQTGAAASINLTAGSVHVHPSSRAQTDTQES